MKSCTLSNKGGGGGSQEIGLNILYPSAPCKALGISNKDLVVLGIARSQALQRRELN